MKKNLAKISALLILSMLAFSLMPLIPKVYAQFTEVYLDPSDYWFNTGNAYVGMLFEVAVWVRNVTDLAAFQVRMYFDDSIINCTEWIEPTTNSSYVFYGKTTMPAPTPPDPGYTHVGPGLGYVQVGSALFPAPPTQPSFTGDGLLCIFVFNITAMPGKGETLQCALSIDNVDTFLLDSGGNEIPGVVKTDGSYKFEWLPPTTNPHFAVVPDLVEFGPDPPSAIGTTFDIEVWIETLDPAWGLTNASFILKYNTTLIDIIGGAADITINPIFDGPNEVEVVHATPYDYVNITVRTTNVLPWDVLVATITFTVMHQLETPPAPPYPWSEDSPLDLQDEEMWNHEMQLTIEPSEDGLVKIYALRTLALPWLEVRISSAEAIFGPEPVIGKEFNVTVVIHDVEEPWHMVGFNFRLGYNDDLLEAVEVYEGEFLADPTWNWYGTLFWSHLHDPPDYPEVPYWNVVVAGLLLPNMSVTPPVYDQTVFPHTPIPGEATLATIKFKIIDQIVSCEEGNLTSPLNLYPLFDGTSPEWFMDKDGNFIPCNETANIHGKVTVLNAFTTGRVIDLFVCNYPDGYNGKGPNEPSDMFWPQKEVCLCAYVTYNCWPVQQKLVTFTVYDPGGEVWTQLIDYTDADGYACVSFRIPWPCENPEELFGVWHVEADVDIACVVVKDTLDFHFDYLVNIIEVSTDAYYYCHCEWVNITVKFTSHAQQSYEVEIRITIHDELNVPIATISVKVNIGGAVFCSPKEYRVDASLYIEKFAFVGYATIHVVPRFYYNGEWVAAGPEATHVIYILPC